MIPLVVDVYAKTEDKSLLLEFDLLENFSPGKIFKSTIDKTLMQSEVVIDKNILLE